MARNQEPRNNATVMLLGMTGSGKSLLGNKLLGLSEDKYVFEVVDEIFAPRTTIAPQIGSARIHNFSLTIIDTPGFFDNESNIENRWIDVLKGVELADGRLDAIIIVINIRRMDGSVSAMKLIMEDFGNVTRKIISVFTNFDRTRRGFDHGTIMRVFNKTYGQGTAGITFIFSDQRARPDFQRESHGNIIEAIRDCTYLPPLTRNDFKQFCMEKFKSSLSRRVRNINRSIPFQHLTRHTDLQISLVKQYVNDEEIQQILDDVNAEVYSWCTVL